MKKKLVVFLIFINACFLLFGASNTRWVSVHESSLKSGTGWFSSTIGNVYYGEKVEIIDENGKWAKIQLSTDSAITGWVTNSSLTTKKITSNESERVSADAKELSLAGKGFTEEIENEYKKDSKLAYAEIDDIEKIVIKNDELYEFFVAGNLKGTNE